MKKILTILVTVFTFTMVASVANAQMHSVGLKKGGMLENGYANARPATGTTDADYPSVRWLINNAKVPTIGELKQEIYQYCIDTWGENPYEGDLMIYKIEDYTSNGRGNYSFTFICTDKSRLDKASASEKYVGVYKYKYKVDPKRAKWGKPIASSDLIDTYALDPKTDELHSTDVFTQGR